MEYNRLLQEYNSYQVMANRTMESLSKKVEDLEGQLSIFINVLEISKYINKNVYKENFIELINNIITNIIGESFSTTFIYRDNDLQLVGPDSSIQSAVTKKKQLISINGNKEFIINSNVSMFNDLNNKEIYSVLGVPIILRDKFLGYILIEDLRKNAYNKQHLIFMTAVAMENNALYSRINEMAEKDSLLHIYNRGCFYKKVIEKIKNPKVMAAVIMIDIDNFKSVNDTFGHTFGDEVLRRTSKIIYDNFSSNGIVARYGGEEIIIYTEDFISKEDIFTKVDKTRQEIQDCEVIYSDIKKNVTSSFGIAICENSQLITDTEKLTDFIKLADNKLYEAKNSGKNKVVI